MTLLAVSDGQSSQRPDFVVADSQGESSAIQGSYLTAEVAADEDRVSTGVETIAGDNRLVGAGPPAEHLRPAQGRSNTAPEFTNRERLRDVVVGAHLEAHHLVDLVILGGQHDDRHLTAAAHAPAHLYPVDFRKHDVEHHQIESLLGETVERLAAVVRRHHLEAVLAERVGEQGLHRVLVVDEQDAGRSLRHSQRVVCVGPWSAPGSAFASIVPRSRPRWW